jgi:hypothetical protein
MRFSAVLILAFVSAAIAAPLANPLPIVEEAYSPHRINI